MITKLTKKDVETIAGSILAMVQEAEKLVAERDALQAENDRLRVLLEDLSLAAAPYLTIRKRAKVRAAMERVGL